MPVEESQGRDVLRRGRDLRAKGDGSANHCPEVGMGGGGRHKFVRMAESYACQSPEGFYPLSYRVDIMSDRFGP
jgi:hypothetical protein